MIEVKGHSHCKINFLVLKWINPLPLKQTYSQCWHFNEENSNLHNSIPAIVTLTKISRRGNCWMCENWKSCTDIFHVIIPSIHLIPILLKIQDCTHRANIIPLQARWGNFFFFFQITCPPLISLQSRDCQNCIINKVIVRCC